VSAVAEIGRKAGRRGWLTPLALALSLLLNICFVAGLIWSTTAAEEIMAPAERFVAIGRGLNLTADENAALTRFGIAAREHGRLLRQSNAPLMGQIWQEMAAPKPDEAHIAQLIERATQNRLAYQKAMTAGLMIFLDSLSAEQRAQFVSIAAHHNAANNRRVVRLVLP
jgi:Spy/CpxP family protein refolding chaperone